MKILIIGGTRFFGKRLTKNLINKGHEVTILSRGSSKDNFEDLVERIICDRLDYEALKKATDGKTWDIIYDQVCFDYKTAKEACEIFNDKTTKYIFTSTISVYENYGEFVETDFNPDNYKFKKLKPPTGNYGEAKRQAEAAFAEFCKIPSVFVRLPIVIGKDDYTKRFAFHINKIKTGQEIYLSNKEAKMSFVTSEDAATALEFLGFSDFTGPINVASPSPIKLSKMISLMEKAIGKTVVYAKTDSPENQSNYNIDKDWYMNCGKLKNTGIEFKELTELIPKLIKQLT